MRKMNKVTDGKPTSLHTENLDLMALTNSNLLRHGLGQSSTTMLENELLHRLEAYIEMYGDYLEKTDGDDTGG